MSTPENVTIDVFGRGPPSDATAAIEIAPVTLEQLAVSMAIGCCVLATTLMLFAGAIRLRITVSRPWIFCRNSKSFSNTFSRQNVAPRCEARPRDVIYNPSPNCHDSQKRGNPFCLGWIFWSLRLSYHTMIEGVPGTGTRNGGLDGHLLNVNLDGIVLLRFHAMGLRISAVAMCIYCFICLPMYRTARCYESYIDPDGINHNCTVAASYNLTRYERLTLANVPSLSEIHAWDLEALDVTFRLYVLVVCTYVVCWYTCYELHKEWIDLLAIRRVYYLEYDHWKGRREELKATMLKDSKGHLKCNSEQPGGAFEEDDNPHLHQREAWIPHPEQRDTPPSIELYSVLVGGLPKRPQQAVSAKDLEAALSDQDQHMDCKSPCG